MGRASKRRTRSRPDKEVRTVDVPLDVCTDVVRRVLASEVGKAVEEPTTGFFVWSEGRAFRRVRYTLRTYAAVQGTRISLEARGDLGGSPLLLLFVALLLVATAGLGLLLVVPFLSGPTTELRREVAMFRLLRVLEQALTPTSGSYRVASGALRNVLPAISDERALPPREDLDATEDEPAGGSARSTRRLARARRLG